MSRGYPAVMGGLELSQEEHDRYRPIAEKSARKASRDPEVVAEAASHALVQYARYRDRGRLPETEQGREGWVRKVARNHAFKVGEALHRDLAMGRHGSAPPRLSNPVEAARVPALLAQAQIIPVRFSSQVAAEQDFRRRWSRLDPEVRALLVGKYVDGLSAQEIAARRGRGESEGAINNRVMRARRAARAAFADLRDPDDEH